MKLTIQLNEIETQLKSLLLSAAVLVKKTGLPAPTLRFCGGWVRDKLLDHPSNDIDVTIDTMSGYDFATFVTKTLESQGIHKKIGKIESNPDKSKHLETATMSLFGLQVDFCHLRSEIYSEHSRIPQISFGTALDDARRRDCTINALFFNIHNDQVEDFLGGGLRDLKDKVIATPINAKETFMDDPLRILRLVRFAAKYDFLLHATIPVAVDEIVRKCLETKVSKERIGIELTKMLETGRKVNWAFKTMDEMGLLEAVLHTKPNLELLFTGDYLVTQCIDINFLEGTNKRIFYLALLYADSDDVVTKLKVGLKSTRNDALLVERLVLKLRDSELCEFNERKSVGLFIRSLELSDQYPLYFMVKMARECCGNLQNTTENVRKYNAFYEFIQKHNLHTCYALTSLLNGKEIKRLFGVKGKDIEQFKEKSIELQLQEPLITKSQVIERLTL